MESKKYTIPQKLVIGLITIIFVGLPIAIWVWLFQYLMLTHWL
jgi:hypothetical protein